MKSTVSVKHIVTDFIHISEQLRELFIYEGQEHGFFGKPEYFVKTMLLADQFLSSLGYIKGEPLMDRIKFYGDSKK